MAKHRCACCGRYVSEPCARTLLDKWYYFCSACERSGRWGRFVKRMARDRFKQTRAVRRGKPQDIISDYDRYTLVAGVIMGALFGLAWL